MSVDGDKYAFIIKPEEDLLPPSPSEIRAALASEEAVHYPIDRQPVPLWETTLSSEWMTEAKKTKAFREPVPVAGPTRRQIIIMKGLHLQRHFWKWQHNANPEPKRPNGAIRETTSAWERSELDGMLAFFRLFFHSPAYTTTYRHHGDGIWRIMLNHSPWWDCPIFDDLKYIRVFENRRPVKNPDGSFKMVDRDPRDVNLEKEFFKRWMENLRDVPLRRWANGELVLPYHFEEWAKEYGSEAHKWWEKTLARKRRQTPLGHEY